MDQSEDEDERTALMYAAGGGHLPVVEALLAKGADVEAKDEDGFTALMQAAYGGHLPVVEALLAKGPRLEIVGAGRNDWARGPTANVVEA